jgi:integrase
VGPRMKLPRYVHGFVDRHGKPRFYFRRSGFESVPLPGLPYSPECMRAYEAALAGQARPRGAARDDPTRDVKAIRIKSGGHHSWTDLEISQFERCHAIGSRARLALALLLYTGQRRGDVIRMGAQHVRGGTLYVKQEKTGAELAIPMHPDLAAVIAATPSGHLTFLTTTIGSPFAATTFTHWFRRECDKAGLPHCSAHGLRKAAARRLAEAGCTAHEIGAITGHASLAELVRYTKAADQRRLAEAAMAKTRTSARKPAGRFAKKAGKVLKIKARK